MKKLMALTRGLMLATLLLATGAMASPATSAQSSDAAQVGIITPQVAYASRIYLYYTFATDGGFLVCPNPVSHTSAGPVCGGSDNNAWLSPQRVVPAGAKYVGYRLLSDVRIEVFYK